jgi:hypothetical protein
MKKVLVLLLLVLVAAYAVDRNITRIQTVLPNPDDNRPQTKITPFTRSTTPVSPYNLLIGRQEVIGYTSYDWQANGPIYRNCIYDPVANGIHCLWMYSHFNQATDRQEYYNFYDFGTNAWNWPATGIGVYTARSGYGGMDNDPISGCAYITAHLTVGGVLSPVAARDQAPGAGLFEYSNGPSGNQWPPNAVTHSEIQGVAALNSTDQDSLWFMMNNPWNTWSTPVRMPDPGASPMFPTQNIAASKTSNKMVVLWQCSEDAYPERAFYKLSTDGGATWGAQTQIPFPPSVGITPGFHISGLSAMYDASDNLHIVASVSDTGFTIPAEIWHYCPTNTPAYKLVHRYEAETLAAAVGYNAIFATRPTITQDAANPTNFYVAWEEFDSLNFEPLTALARADIYVAKLTNNGTTVERKGRITDPNTTSKRFPVIGGIKNDTVFVMYLIDSIAGMELYTQGVATNNPVVVQRFYKGSLPIAVEENPSNQYYSVALKPASPNPFVYTTNITYTVPISGIVNLTIYDILGRPIRTMVSGTKTPGEYTAIWDGKDANGNKTQAGIYFYTLRTADKSVSRKIIRTN